MYKFDSYDPSEFRATMEELQDRNHSAPTKIPIAKSPHGGVGRKRNRWEPRNDRRKFGDLDGRFAQAISRRCRNDFVAEMLYGGEDEMIEALDAAETAA